MVRTRGARIASAVDSLSTRPSALRATLPWVLLAAAVVQSPLPAAPVRTAVGGQLMNDAAAAAQPRVQPESSAGGWVLTFSGYAPGSLVVPVLRGRDRDGGGGVLVGAAPVQADASGRAQSFLPAPAADVGSVEVAGVDLGGNGASGWSLLTYYAPVPIGGWNIKAVDCSYDSGSGVVVAHVTRDPNPEGESQVETLWVAILDESAAGAELVKLQSFVPGAIAVDEPHFIAEDNYSLQTEHVLRLRVFDHQPSTSELTSGGLLWDS